VLTPPSCRDQTSTVQNIAHEPHCTKPTDQFERLSIGTILTCRPSAGDARNAAAGAAPGAGVDNALGEAGSHRRC